MKSRNAQSNYMTDFYRAGVVSFAGAPDADDSVAAFVSHPVASHAALQQQKMTRRAWIIGSLVSLVCLVLFVILTTPTHSSHFDGRPTVRNDEEITESPTTRTAAAVAAAARRHVVVAAGKDAFRSALGRITTRVPAPAHRVTDKGDDDIAIRVAITTTATALARTTFDPRPATWSLRESVVCVDINPLKHVARNVFVPSLIDDKTNPALMAKMLHLYRLTEFHACQLHGVWVMGSASGAALNSEARGGVLAILPPPPDESKRKLSLQLHKQQQQQKQQHVSAKEMEKRVQLQVDAQFVPFRRQVFRFPHTPFSSSYRLIIEDQEDSRRLQRKLNRNSDSVHLIGGVTMLISPHYCCRHVMHYMEPLGCLQQVLKRWILPPLLSQDRRRRSNRSSSDSNRNNNFNNASFFFSPPVENIMCNSNESESSSPQCFRTIDRVVFLSSSGVVANTFNWHATLALLFLAYYQYAGYTLEKAFDMAVSTPLLPASKKSEQYERMITAGAIYDVWATQQMAQEFQDAFHLYFDERARRNISMPLAMGATIDATTTETTNTVRKISTPRKIVHFKRSGLRQITSSADFLVFLQQVAHVISKAGASSLHAAEASDDDMNPISVVEVTAGSMNVERLRDTLRDATILIGMHGMDLTNVLLAPRFNTTLIELNPAFFFEPRFSMLSGKLGIRYRSWQCYSTACAFGGDARQFRIAFPLHDVDYEERENGALLVSRRDSNMTAWYPAIDGSPCSYCANYSRLMHATSLESWFFSAYRGSSVNLSSAKHKREIGSLILDAAVHAGWISSGAQQMQVERWLKEYGR